MTRIILIILLSGFFNAASAQDKKPVEKPKADSVKSTPKTISDFVTAKAISKKGMFSIHQVGEKYYFEIPDSLLGRELLLTTWLVKVPGGSPKFGGEIMYNRTVSFTKWNCGSKIALNVTATINQVDTTNVISTAVKNANVNSVAMLFDIKARGNTGTSLIDATDFLQKENSFTMLNAEVKSRMSVGSMAADRSSLKSFAAYPINIEIKMMRTYSATTPPAIPGRPAVAPLEAAKLSGAITMEISTSIMLMPEKPMTPRRFDARVGYFADAYQEYADAQQKVDTKIFIVRYRLEPKPEDMERYKRGELVEPKVPIVYYIDPATPKQWRPYIIAGINGWNEAFKPAGFKNAIIGKEWPENDSTMSLEDARCKVVRYFPSSSPFSYAPRIYDPRSGEILQTYIGWSHSKLKSLHEWYFVQASASDPNARSMTFSNELMGALIRADISKQVGYSLGLRTNLIGSNAYPVEKLRDKNFVEANGFSASIMDNINYNYVAQPEDKISQKGLIPQIGEYDKWAIKYGYTYTGNNDFDKEKKTVLSWINKIETTNSNLKFGADKDVNPSEPSDPRSQSEDLSNNPVKAGEYAVKNMKIVMANLLTWTREDMDMYDNTARMYDNVMDWWLMVMRHSFSQLGGVKEDLKTVEQPGDVYTPVSKEAQKQAMAFLQKELFQTPTWLLDQKVLNKISKPAKREKLQRFQEEALYQLMRSARMYRMNVEEMRYGKDKMYTLDEFLNDIENSLWSELRSAQPVISSDRRSLQKNWINMMKSALSDASTAPAAGSASPDMTTTDVPVIVRAHMEKMMKECKAAAASCKDPMTLAHIQYTQGKLSKILDPKK